MVSNFRKNNFHTSKLFLFVLVLLIILILQLVDFCFFQFQTHLTNQFLIFGLAGSNLWAIIISTLVSLILILLYFKKIIGVEFILILAGLISNIIDRIIYQGVIDYFTLPLIPQFNLADIVIVAGGIFWAFRVIRTI